jgi:hypothetical protein
MIILVYDIAGQELKINMPTSGKGNNVIRISASAKGVAFLYRKTGHSVCQLLCKIELQLLFLVIRIVKDHIISPFAPTNFQKISLKPKGSQKSYKAGNGPKADQLFTICKSMVGEICSNFL